MRLFFHPEQDSGGVVPNAEPSALQVVSAEPPAASAAPVAETQQPMTVEDIALAEAYLAHEKARLGVGVSEATPEVKQIVDLSTLDIPTLAVPDGADAEEIALIAAENARWQAVGNAIKQIAEAVNKGLGNPGLNAVIATTERQAENVQYASDLAKIGKQVSPADVEAARGRYPNLHPTAAVVLALSDAATAQNAVTQSTPQMAAPQSVDGQEQFPMKMSGADAIAMAERQRQTAAAGN